MAGKQAAGLAHQPRIAHRDGAKDDAGDALGEPGLHMVEGADAASKLHRVLRRLEDGVHRVAVAAFTGEGAVEVDHMQPLEALVLEGARLRARIVAEDGGLVHVAELQAHALSGLEVDGGVEMGHCRSVAWPGVLTAPSRGSSR